MTTFWWQGEPSRLEQGAWPTLTSNSTILSLGRPDDEDAVDYEAIAQSMATLVPLARKTARLLLYLYGRSEASTIADQVRDIIASYEIPS